MCARHKDRRRVCYQEEAKRSRGNSAGLRQADFRGGDAGSHPHSDVFTLIYSHTIPTFNFFLTFITYRRVNPHLCFSSVREEILEVTSRALEKKTLLIDRYDQGRLEHHK